MNGLNLLRKLRTEGREFRVIIITNGEDFQQAKQAIRSGGGRIFSTACPADGA